MIEKIKISESYLEEILHEKIVSTDHCKIFDEYVPGGVVTQLNIAPYGIIDMATFSIELSSEMFGDTGKFEGVLNCTIYELKVTEFHVDNICQIARYKDRVQDYLEKTYPQYDVNIRGAIVCPSINPEPSNKHTPVYILNQIDWLYLFTYHIDVDTGLSFRDMSDGWHDPKCEGSLGDEISGVVSFAEDMAIDLKKVEESGLLELVKASNE